MKKYIYVLLASITLLSCSEAIEDNRPALQGIIDGELYRAIDAQAIRGLDGSLRIKGLTTGDDLTLRLTDVVEGTYILGGENPNFAQFTTPNGFTYNTNPLGEGTVIISRLDNINQKVYGSFEFDAVIDGLDTINVRNGVYFEVPIVQETEVPPTIIPEDFCNAGFFVAMIDNTHSLDQGLSTCVSAFIRENQIVITGADLDEEIQISLPITIGVGQHDYPNTNFNATYTNLTTAVTEEGTVGSFIVLSHNTAANLIKVTFNFDTQNHIIDGASFNVHYQ